MADESRMTGLEGGWPLPKFGFLVAWDGHELSFEAASGLEAESDANRPQSGGSPVFSTIKMPGLVKYGNITLKKGIFVGDRMFLDWLERTKGNPAERRDIEISLVDENGGKVMTWMVSQAWPRKVVGTDLKSDGNEVAIESIEISHEGLTPAN